MRTIKMAGAIALAAGLPIGAGAQDGSSTVDEFGKAVAQEFLIDDSARMTVQVRINGSDPFPFVVDTGSERTVVSHDLAQKLALKAGPQLTLATITGKERVGSFVIDNLAMTAVKVQRIEAPALERQHLGAFGLVGIDSLEDHKVLLDFKTGQMDVLPSKRSRSKTQLEDGMIVVTATRRAGRMILSSATIDGRKVDIILDTGAQISMGNLALKKRLRPNMRRSDYVPVVLRSVTGDALVGDYTQIRNIEVGGLTMKDLPIVFSNNYAFEALDLNDRPAILLGMDALQLFDRVIIDFANKRVAFDLPGRSERAATYSLAALTPFGSSP